MNNFRLSTVFVHIAGWILFLSLPVLFITGQPGNKDLFSIIVSPYTWLFFLVYIFIFYLNSYLLIPYPYLQKKFLLYAGVLVVLFAGVFFLRPFDNLLSNVSDQRATGRHEQPPPPRNSFDEFGSKMNEGPRHDQQNRDRDHVDIVSIFLFILVLALSIAIDTRQRLKLTEQRALQAETGKANAELSFLKAQINPHFLFNTLNNIYSLAVTKNEHTAESIMKLSNIMRYVTDDVREDFVPLENEIECMGDYIDLQRLRLGEKMKVNFQVEGNTTNKKIAPLVLITFIENVFKYGISNHEPSDIVVKLNVDAKGIHFFCQNRLFTKDKMADSTGIGIANTRQRLLHLYAGTHSLDINQENGLFTVQLFLAA